MTVGGTKVLGLLTTVALARLLDPEDFGLFALATLVTLFLTIFRDFGLGSVLILRQDLDRRSQATVTTLMLAAGFLGACVVIAVSPVAALVFGEPRLTGVMASLSVILAFGGLAWSYDVVMQRELAFRKRFAAQMAQSLTYSVVAVAMASAGAGVWSLVGAAVVSGGVGSIAFVALAPYRLPLAMDREVAAGAFRTGQGFIGQGVLALIRQNADYLVIGRLLGARPLGLYTLAYRFAELPYVGLADPAGKVMFPTFSRMRSRGEDVAAAFVSAQRAIALVTCPLGVVLSAVAEPFVEAILGQKWLEVVPALTILGLWGALRPLENTVAVFLNAMGEAHVVAKVLAVLLLVLLPSFVLAAHLGGLAAVASVTLIEMVVTLPVLWRCTRSHVAISARQYWRAFRPIALACSAAWGAAWLTARLQNDALPLVRLALSSGAGMVAYVGVVALADPELLRRSGSQIARMLRNQTTSDVEAGGAAETGSGGPGSSAT